MTTTSASPTQQNDRLLELRTQLKKKEGILASKSIVQRLPDKGEKLKKQVEELREQIQKILIEYNVEEGAITTQEVPETKELESTPKQQLPQPQELSNSILVKNQSAKQEQVEDEFEEKLANSSIEELNELLQNLRIAKKKQEEISRQSRSKQENFLMKASESDPKPHIGSTKYKQQSELLLKGKRGVEHQAKTRQVQVLDLSTSLEQQKLEMEQSILMMIERSKRLEEQAKQRTRKQPVEESDDEEEQYNSEYEEDDVD